MKKRNASCKTPAGYTKTDEMKSAVPLPPAGRPSLSGRRIKAYPKGG
jgi:hypothetical protein